MPDLPFSSERYGPAERRMAQALVALENRILHPRPTEDCACRQGMFPGLSRRGMLLGGALLGGALVARPARAEAPPGAIEYPVQPDPTREQGRVILDDGGYGSRSQFENEIRWRYPTASLDSSWSMTPLASGQGIITPSGLHFERHHGGIPNIDPQRHALILHGMVDKPLRLTMDDLKRMPSASRITFIECSGNGLTEWEKPTLRTVQGTHGLTSTSEWTGVRLSTVLAEAGVQDGAAWILAEGADAAVMTRSIPIDKAMDDAILAYAQNGEALRPEQGYPLRLLLPGYEGNTQIKWLRRLEVGDKPFMTREETLKYTDLLPDGTARQFTLTMDAKSVITFPSGAMQLPRPGFYEITGLAWSGRGRIAEVEVSADGGKTWAKAALQEPVLDKCHTRFRLPWVWDGAEAVLQSRCTDETGYRQPTLAELVQARGTRSVYHLNAIQSWRIAQNGEVSNVHA
ncbi:MULTISPECIES: sulfite dehydrogenase [Paracoccus]|uniref:sulfite dehydrogenase n=1 Tax=Paracoccus TaxID=265 RepID=UPI001FB6DDDE|nr:MULTISPECIES: sulfite dehydrogenase [Paracoccus]MCJ1901988.1 sulfite dehydrogenase [Paracoccus versutus]MDF3904370.1 sulfite dehydrogenase [Paracoccus sp. AS002]